MLLDLVCLSLMLLMGILLSRVFGREKKPVSQSQQLAVKDLIKANVWFVFDGDTVSVSIKGELVRIRLDSIDCPEDGQAWGDIAKAGLIKMIGGKTIYLERYGLDSYGRTLATIFVKNGSELVNVNERMVTLGHAWVYRMYYGHLPEARKRRLDELEDWAQAKRVGLWKSDFPMPPWEWRHQIS